MDLVVCREDTLDLLVAANALDVLDEGLLNCGGRAVRDQVQGPDEAGRVLVVVVHDLVDDVGARGSVYFAVEDIQDAELAVVCTEGVVGLEVADPAIAAVDLLSDIAVAILADDRASRLYGSCGGAHPAEGRVGGARDVGPGDGLVDYGQVAIVGRGVTEGLLGRVVAERLS